MCNKTFLTEQDLADLRRSLQPKSNRWDTEMKAEMSETTFEIITGILSEYNGSKAGLTRFLIEHALKSGGIDAYATHRKTVEAANE